MHNRLKLERFLRENLVAVSFHSYTPIFIKHHFHYSNHSSMKIFYIYVYPCPVNIHYIILPAQTYRTFSLNKLTKFSGTTQVFQCSKIVKYCQMNSHTKFQLQIMFYIDPTTTNLKTYTTRHNITQLCNISI